MENESTSAAVLDQSAIWYSACNEDTASEIAALQPKGKRLLCITASGSRAFDLLLADPAHIVSIDQNPAQTALAELFAAAYRTFDYASFSGLVGLREEPARLDLIDKLLPQLSPPSREFWRRNRGIAAEGLLYCGRWEGFLRQIRRWAGKRRRKLADRLLAAPDRETQWALWRQEWDDWRWRLFVRAMTARSLWRWVMREPGIAFIDREFDMTAYTHDCFNHAARDLHLRDLPFAWLMLSGGYDTEVLPPYLTEAGHAAIAQRVDRLELRTLSLQQAIAEAEPGSFDGASLSDYSSYCDDTVQRRVWADLARGIRPGGLVCERKFYNKSGTDIPLESGFTRNRKLEDALRLSDGALFYSFVVARREGIASRDACEIRDLRHS
ncbi:DUF3419 family protein [Aurantiacibacter zhengii]|uniref:DUF3419 family protein n=1 Tax=Aurantiacibacter zhengii TaxID=2307003 RepID=A0A418NVT9_9SPHN|nr:DUF3419 family protein [Aurantiacibacter zhengii]RIV88739.1 DUF3419 family protein [Aurantiacibacter zhengii]